MRRSTWRTGSIAVLALLGACGGEDAPPVTTPPPVDPGPAPAVQTPGESGLARLTAVQYARSIHDIFGDSIVVPGNLEPDDAVEGLIAVGTRLTSVSPLGVERYETAAYDIAAQAMQPGPRRDALVPCTPAGSVDQACARETLESLGLLVWRRPLTTAELDGLVAIAGDAGGALGDFYAGLEFSIAALVQSPRFLFRVELGQPDPAAPDRVRFDDYEMAQRLSFFLWNTTPDAELLAAAAAGELTTDEGLRQHAERLAASPRARDAVRDLFTDLYKLYALDGMVKDPTVFSKVSPEVGPSAREETLRLIDYLVFEKRADIRDLITTRTSFVNRKLASIYEVRAPSRDGFGMIEWPESSPRRGILTQLSLLAGNSHPVVSSATLRGKFVRDVLLCGVILPPPTNVDTALPESSSAAPTLRDRIQDHLQNEFCASCHLSMDPIGLGFENFDALGSFRTTENGVTIDASGDLDGVAYRDPVELAQAVHDHPDLAGCMAENLYRYANMRESNRGERELLDWLEARFASAEYRLPALMVDIATSSGFRIATPASDDADAQGVY